MPRPGPYPPLDQGDRRGSSRHGDDEFFEDQRCKKLDPADYLGRGTSLGHLRFLALPFRNQLLTFTIYRDLQNNAVADIS